MSKAAKAIAVVATVVAIAATAGGAIMGAAAFAATFGASASTVAAIASSVATAASMAAAALQKRPALKGSVSQVLIGATMPIPYGMGRSYTGGMQIYDNSAGTENRRRWNINVVTAAGPIDSFESLLVDYTPVTFTTEADGDNANGWFNDFLWREWKTGTRPDTFVFSDDLPSIPGWTTNHKLSGYAAYKVKMIFDKDGKRFASGVPQFGVVAKLVKVYDPRLDSTYPGGSGTQRWDDELTWAWSENPALHGLAYARGRYIEKDASGNPLATPVKLLGCGLPKDAIDIAGFVEFANICDANGWTIGGFVYEAPDVSKWDNLKRILQAGGAKPIWASGMLRVLVSAPKTSLFEITLDDLAEGTVDVKAMKGWRDRRNSIVPKYRAEAHKWEYVQSAAVTASTYVDEDGELKTEEVQYDLVQDKDQAAQLAAYDLVNGREFGPIVVTVKPKLMGHQLGEAGTIHIPEAGLFEQPVVILGRSVDVATGAVKLTMESETTAKHAYALSQTGTAPPTPVIRSSEEMDTSTDIPGTTELTLLISNSQVRDLDLELTSAGVMTISNHDRVYTDKVVAVTGTTITTSPAAAPGDSVAVYYDDEGRVGGAVTYVHEVFPGGAGSIDHLFASAENPYRHFVAMLTVPTTGTAEGGSGVGPGTGGTGGGGGYISPYNPIP